jgi:hypothetical protein
VRQPPLVHLLIPQVLLYIISLIHTTALTKSLERTKVNQKIENDLNRAKHDYYSSVLLLLTAVGVIYYWADFYIRGGVHVVEEDWYIRFEKAFPPADIWMSVCAIIGAVGLLTHQSYSLLFALLSAASLIFLALMDITFNVQNNLYRLVASSSEMKFELFLNIWTLGFGIALIACLWPKMAIL